MLGERGPQRGLLEADYLYIDFVGRHSFYGFLAAQRGTLFRDEDFAALYAPGHGRPSVPPSLLATALVLQTLDRVSDAEAKQRADYDLRWKVALGIALDERPFAKSTLQEFRAQLVIHQQPRVLFQQSLQLATQQGFLQGKRKLKVALDTTAILGRGAVKDTYNLLGDGIVQVLRVLAQQAREPLADWAEREGCGRYVAEQSLKGQATLNWDDPQEQRQFLQGIVADADRVLERVRQARSGHEEGSPADRALVEAAGLLSRLLAQDIERRPDGAALRQGVAPDRVVSVHDPEQRHGHKSAAKRFNGHKAALAVDTESQLITAVTVLPGNAPDHEQALELVEQTEEATGCAVAAAIADCAYGDGPTRQAFATAGRELIAKVPAATNQGAYPKTAFTIDVAAGTCTCPAGETTRDLRRTARGGGTFHFPAAGCAACPLRGQCVRGKGGRTVQLHPQEALLHQARAFQASPAFGEYRRRRQVAEHRIARLVQLGIRQARYCGRPKTLFQLCLAAAVANLTLLAYRAASQPGHAPLGAALLALIVLVVLRSARSPLPALAAEPLLMAPLRHSAAHLSLLGTPMTPPSRPRF
jgi:hypothetical protein